MLVKEKIDFLHLTSNVHEDDYKGLLNDGIQGILVTIRLRIFFFFRIKTRCIPLRLSFFLSLIFSLYYQSLFPILICNYRMSPLSISRNADKPFIFDMTSDTATIPTDEMFDIMKAATRGDDVYQVSRMILTVDRFILKHACLD